MRRPFQTGPGGYHHWQKRLARGFTTLASLTANKILNTGTSAYSYIGQNGGNQNWKHRSLDFGLITSALSEPRQFQFGLRFTF